MPLPVEYLYAMSLWDRKCCPSLYVTIKPQKIGRKVHSQIFDIMLYYDPRSWSKSPIVPYLIPCRSVFIQSNIIHVLSHALGRFQKFENSFNLHKLCVKERERHIPYFLFELARITNAWMSGLSQVNKMRIIRFGQQGYASRSPLCTLSQDKIFVGPNKN